MVRPWHLNGDGIILPHLVSVSMMILSIVRISMDSGVSPDLVLLLEFLLCGFASMALSRGLNYCVSSYGGSISDLRRFSRFGLVRERFSVVFPNLLNQIRVLYNLSPVCSSPKWTSQPPTSFGLYRRPTGHCFNELLIFIMCDPLRWRPRDDNMLFFWCVSNGCRWNKTFTSLRIWMHFSILITLFL